MKCKEGNNMEPTILTSILNFIGVSAAGGIIWDGLKSSGKLVTSFVNHFVNKGHFGQKEQAEIYLENIAEKDTYNDENPLHDAWLMYKKCTKQEASEAFKADFVEWLRENSKEIIENNQTYQNNGIFIKKQINKGNAQVTMIDTQNNFRG